MIVTNDSIDHVLEKLDNEFKDDIFDSYSKALIQTIAVKTKCEFFNNNAAAYENDF